MDGGLGATNFRGSQVTTYVRVPGSQKHCAAWPAPAVIQSVRRASACRMVQISDGPWLGSGSPAFFSLSGLLRARAATQGPRARRQTLQRPRWMKGTPYCAKAARCKNTIPMSRERGRCPLNAARAEFAFFKPGPRSGPGPVAMATIGVY